MATVVLEKLTAGFRVVSNDSAASGLFANFRGVVWSGATIFRRFTDWISVVVVLTSALRFGTGGFSFLCLADLRPMLLSSSALRLVASPEGGLGVVGGVGGLASGKCRVAADGSLLGRAMFFMVIGVILCKCECICKDS